MASGVGSGLSETCVHALQSPAAGSSNACGEQAADAGGSRLQQGARLVRALQGVVVAEGAQGHGAPVMACQRKQHLQNPIQLLGLNSMAEQQCLRRELLLGTASWRC